MEHISDLFGKERVLGKKGPLSERASLISFFVEALQRDTILVGLRLAHYSLDELYALKSTYLDRLHRNGRESAVKYLWAISRTKVIPS